MSGATSPVAGQAGPGAAPPGPASTSERPPYARDFNTYRYGSHQIVSSLVGEGARVLEVGCGEGALSANLKAMGNEVVSLERDADRVEAAKHRGLNVVHRDIERDRIDDLGTFDVVVLADVLEHLVDPAAAVRKVRERLRPHGKLVVSVPNIAFYNIRFKLLIGQFDYNSWGILDETHVRFFTRSSARAMIEGAGFRIVREDYSLYFPLPFLKMTWAINTLLESKRFGAGLHRFFRSFPGFFGFQFITQSVLAIDNGETGSDRESSRGET